MKSKIIKVKKHFQRIKYLNINDEWHLELMKCHLKDKIPVGHFAYIEKDNKGIARVLMDLTIMFGNAPISEIKRNFKPYKPYQNYNEGESL